MKLSQPPHNPGRPRNRLQTKFLHALADDFEKHGAEVIKIARIEEPVRYLQIVASLMPKELAVTESHLGDLSDEEVHALLGRIRETLMVVDVEPEAPALLPMKVIPNEQETNGSGVKAGRGSGRARSQAPDRGE
jgi:hypothetical protein